MSSARGLGADRKFVPIFTVKMLVRTCAQKVMETGRLKRVAKAWVRVQTRDREKNEWGITAGNVDTMLNFWHKVAIGLRRSLGLGFFI